MLHVNQWGQEYFHDLPHRMAERDASIKQLEASKSEQQIKKNDYERALLINEHHQLLVKAAINRINLPNDLRLLSDRLGRADMNIYNLEAKLAEMNGLVRQDSLREKVLKALNDLRVYDESYHGHIYQESQLNAEFQRLDNQRHTMMTQHRKIESELQHAKDQINELQAQEQSAERDVQIGNLQRYIPVYMQSQSLIQTNLLPINQKLTQLKMELITIRDQKEKVTQQKQEAVKLAELATPDLLSKPPVNHAMIASEMESLKKKISKERDNFEVELAVQRKIKMLLAEAEQCQIGDYQSFDINQLQEIELNLPVENKAKREAIRQCQEEIAKIDAQLSILQQGQAADEDHRIKMQQNEWMMNYHRDPEKLIRILTVGIQDVLTGYEYTHPANQHERLRIILREWQYMCVRSDMQKQQYFPQLLAWLSHAKQAINDISPSLAAELEVILSQHPIQEYDNLVFPLINQEELHAQELHEYNIALELLNQTIADLPQESDKALKLLYQSASLLAKEVDEYFKIENHAQKNVFDKKYYTSVLHSINDVLHNPVNYMYQNKYKHLIAFNNNGRSSLEYKVSAALLGCLGVMIIAASLLTMMLTAFVVTPLAMTAIGIGTAMVSGAAGFLVAGRQKGVDKSMVRMKQKLGLFKAERDPKLFSTPSLLVFQ